ncbi:MAG: pseudouridine synthase [Burkholderiales bacterium]|nr:pseudouridine synthase [Burkholderiales bacterium]
MLTILHRDRHLIAIDKPAGLLVHRSNLDRHADRFAVQLLRDQIGAHVHPLHRLDRGTSGVLLFALDGASAAAVGRQFQDNQVRKRYLAVVRGWPPPAGLIDHALRPAPGEAPAEAAAPPRPAQTAYRRLATIELPVRVDRYPASRYALLALEPRTGRTHQLRRHLKHIAHPIIGDATHGKGAHNRYFRDHLGCARLLLACTEIGISHPATGERLTVACAPGDAFAAILDRFGWRDAAGVTAAPRRDAP